MQKSLTKVTSEAQRTVSSTNGDEKCDEENSEELRRVSTKATLVEQIHENDPNGLKRLLASIRNKEEVKVLVNDRDDAGKSPLDVAAALGRVEITKMLIAHGAKIDNFTSKGYNCLHHAAAWGRQQTLQVLVESGGNFQRKTIYGENPIDIAKRYNHLDCAELLEIVGEKKKLQAEITRITEKIKDIDKISAGRITKDEKNFVINLCIEKQEWHDTVADTSSSLEISAQHALLTDAAQTLFNKLSDSEDSKATGRKESMQVEMKMKNIMKPKNAGIF